MLHLKRTIKALYSKLGSKDRVVDVRKFIVILYIVIYILKVILFPQY